MVLVFMVAMAYYRGDAINHDKERDANTDAETNDSTGAEVGARSAYSAL
jgi:DhnA family fructose-bisphosphate aldolase class Ia